MTATTIEFARKEWQAQKNMEQPQWQRVILLGVLGYEAAGCLLGGSLLVAAPDGRYMDMPVDIMHGVFRDFLVPGILLVGLGILTGLSFVSVLRRASLDWFMAGLALGALSVWFIVEIIILRELHWLHYMWGFPVFLGIVMAIPQFVFRNERMKIRKALLACGIFSSLWYVAINIFVPMMYDNYSTVSFTVSELSAIGAPTRILWVLLVLLFPLLFTAFGWGIWQFSEGNRALRMLGALVIGYGILNFNWPPMHQREVIAGGGGTLTDTLHIAWAMITLLFMMLMMIFGAAALGKKFLLYTMATTIVFIVFGILTGLEAPGISDNLPTPLIGVWERINIGAFMLWVMMLSIALLQRSRSVQQRHRPIKAE